MYSDITDALGEIAGSMSKLSATYDRGRALLDQAVELHLGSGTARVDRDVLRTAVEEISPPISPESLEDLATSVEVGLLVHGETLLAPASVLLDPRVSAQLDINAWRSLGILTRGSTANAARRVRDQFPNAPEAIFTPENMRRLRGEAKGEQARVRSFERYSGLPPGSLQHPNGGPSDPPVKGGAAPPSANGAGYSRGSSTAGIDAYIAAATCLIGANWTMHWYGPEICMDQKCADAVEAALVGSNWESFVIAFVQLSMKVFELVISGSGWVGACIAAGEYYWGAMIAGNKSPRGVCLFIPGPWTFGLLGPGWAVGR
jgi:hypothetical protein